MPLGLERRHNLGHLHFITFSCHSRLPYLETPKPKEILEQVIERSANRPTLRVESDSVTVAHMADYLRQRLEIEDTPVSLVEAIGGSNSPSIVTAAVLALLEMVRVGAVVLRQDAQFGHIRIKKTSDFEQVMNTKVSSDQLT